MRRTRARPEILPEFDATAGERLREPITAKEIPTLSDADLINAYKARQERVQFHIDRRNEKHDRQTFYGADVEELKQEKRYEQDRVEDAFADEIFRLLRTEIDRRHREKKLTVPLPPTMGELEEGK